MSAKLVNFLQKDELKRLQELQLALDEFALTAVIHPAGVLINSNDKLLRMSGYGSNDMYRKPFHSFLSEEFRKFFIEHVVPLLNRGICWRGELCHIARNHSQFWTEATIVPIMDSTRKVQYFQFIGFEITERKAVETALNNNAVFFTRLMEIAPIGFFLADANGYCTYINTIWSETSGCRLRRALGQGWLRAVHPEDRIWVEETWLAFIQGAQPFNCEYRYLHTSGRTVWVLAAAEYVDFAPNTRTRYVRVEKDLTLRKDSEQLITEQRAQMVAASKMSALGEMAGGIAHEINNPLAILQLRARQILQLLESATPDAGRLQQAAENIRETTDRIAAIIRALRAIAREGHDDPILPTRVNALIEHTLELCSARFQSHDITLTVAPYDTSLCILCRSVEILQVLLNILNNAFSAALETQERWVEFSIHDAGDSVEFWVTDSGLGIPSAIQEKIFLPFFTTKPVGSGTGLGLSISKAVAQDHHGDLVLDTSCHHTRLVLAIPKCPAETTP